MDMVRVAATNSMAGTVTPVTSVDASVSVYDRQTRGVEPESRDEAVLDELQFAEDHPSELNPGPQTGPQATAR
jgi:hypothetical protein